MIKGVERGYTYKLRIIFAHFPISVKVKGKEVHVENFFGERSARISRIIGSATKVSVVGEDVVIQGPSLEDFPDSEVISNNRQRQKAKTSECSSTACTYTLKKKAYSKPKDLFCPWICCNDAEPSSSAW